VAGLSRRHINKEGIKLVFFNASTALVDLGFLIVEVSRSHSIGLLRMSEQLIAQTSTWQHTILTRDKTPMPPAGFKPKLPANERPSTAQPLRSSSNQLVSLKSTVHVTYNNPNRWTPVKRTSYSRWSLLHFHRKWSPSSSVCLRYERKSESKVPHFIATK
jgi:hypothetical protein